VNYGRPLCSWSRRTRRVTAEQANGMPAERWGTGTDEAFEALRRHARAHRIRMAEPARAVTEGAVDAESPLSWESSP
jgi:AmiR/NasT family two-component response regulator